MCGIAGCIGTEAALPFLINGLKKLEYRGYDSAGIAVYDNGNIIVRRKVGKISELEKAIAGETINGTYGIAHTRWATHGAPSDRNSHPHRNDDGHFAVVHNGIIENYLDLKKELMEKGHVFSSETDTEVLPNLLADCYEGDLLQAVWKAEKRLRGSYAAVFMTEKEPGVLVAIRKDSPLIVGYGKNGNYLASDIPALIGYVDQYIVLKNDESAVLTKDSITVYQNGEKVEPEVLPLTMDIAAAEKGGYDHFMLKEIHEQPYAIAETLRGRVEGTDRIILPELDAIHDKFKTFNKAYFVACGTAYHACLSGAYVPFLL